MIVINYIRTTCPYCQFQCIRTIDTWHNSEATMRLHECRRCRTRFASRDRFDKRAELAKLGKDNRTESDSLPPSD